MAISPASCTRHTAVLPLSTHLTCSSISPSSKGCGLCGLFFVSGCGFVCRCRGIGCIVMFREVLPLSTYLTCSSIYLSSKGCCVMGVELFCGWGLRDRVLWHLIFDVIHSFLFHQKGLWLVWWCALRYTKVWGVRPLCIYLTFSYISLSLKRVCEWFKFLR